MFSLMLTFGLVFAALIAPNGVVFARPSFMSAIPNGRFVPNPCGSTGTWAAVGHVLPTNGAAGMNAFGNDFAAAGNKWTVALCQKDSDGDGRTNGEELGDPNCVWTSGTAPTRTTMLGHPGICEPIASDLCRPVNSFLNGDNCPAWNDMPATTTTSTTTQAPQPPTTPTTQSTTTTTTKRSTTIFTTRTTTTRPPPPLPTIPRPTRGPLPTMPSSTRDYYIPRSTLRTTATAGSQNPWELMRDCVCYCLDLQFDIFGNQPFNGPATWNGGDEENAEFVDDGEQNDDEDNYYYNNDYYTTTPRYQFGNRGSSYGRGRGLNNGRGVAQPSQQRGQQGQGRGQQAPGRGSPSQQGWQSDWSQYQPGNNEDDNESGWEWPQQRSTEPPRLSGFGRAGNGQRSGTTGRLAAPTTTTRRPGPARYMPPPVDHTPEFNNTEQYNIRRPCTCACPKI